MRRRTTLITLFATPLFLVAAPALACGGLVAPNGAVQLLRTTTLAAYVDGVEHYVTAFEFSGAEGEFGSIVPLPDVPTKVQKGGEWTLQRLLLEVAPPVEDEVFAVAEEAPASRAEVLLEKKVGALDIAVLRGGAEEVVAWTEQHGFALSEDAPEVLAFYARRSPIFMAARFDAARAARQGLGAGDGTPIHLTIPTENPWVPLHILSLGKPADQIVEADVFLLTEEAPAILPTPRKSDDPTAPGLVQVRQEEAGGALLADLRSDRGMRWLPESGMTLTYLGLNIPAGDLGFDLALDVHGGTPSVTDVGVEPVPSFPTPANARVWIISGVLGVLGALVLYEVRRTARA